MCHACYSAHIVKLHLIYFHARVMNCPTYSEKEIQILEIKYLAHDCENFHEEQNKVCEGTLTSD
jgi:hypothetical protein